MLHRARLEPDGTASKFVESHRTALRDLTSRMSKRSLERPHGVQLQPDELEAAQAQPTEGEAAATDGDAAAAALLAEAAAAAAASPVDPRASEVEAERGIQELLTSRMSRSSVVSRATYRQ